MARVVSIGFGSREQIVECLADLLEQAERGDEPMLQVAGNGINTPRLDLQFVNEGDPEITEPMVDYRED